MHLSACTSVRTVAQSITGSLRQNGVIKTEICFVAHIMQADIGPCTAAQKHYKETKSVQGSNKQGGQVEPETKPGVYKKDNN